MRLHEKGLFFPNLVRGMTGGAADVQRRGGDVAVDVVWESPVLEDSLVTLHAKIIRKRPAELSGVLVQAYEEGERVPRPGGERAYPTRHPFAPVAVDTPSGDQAVVPHCEIDGFGVLTREPGDEFSLGLHVARRAEGVPLLLMAHKSPHPCDNDHKGPQTNPEQKSHSGDEA